MFKNFGRHYDPRYYTADVHGTTIKETLDNIKKLGECDIKVIEVYENGKLYYEVILHPLATNAVQTFCFDPEKGYEAIASTMKGLDGTLLQKIVVEFVQCPDGGWISKKHLMEFYKVVEEGKPTTLMSSRTFTAENFKFGPVEPEVFTLKGLGVPVGAKVWDKRYNLGFPISNRKSA